MKVDESNFETLDRVSKITGVDYGIIWRDAENIDGYIDEDAMLEMIQDLICEIDRLQEEIEDLKQFYEDNYKPKSDREMYGVWDDDFI